ncbi:hypothetical protein HOLleu_38136 [Holothuria leucospilota]|uniref:Uncharacterized protein n=1 Tax=Holothuria leucospilota TaxID=206669 RepID=A0A9Q1BCV5_HOLLE|nr:hypothetical protein HOLleu_38136 [Holothuria leucospilota]
MLRIATTTISISVVILELSCLILSSSDVLDDRRSVKIGETLHSRLAHSDNKTESVVPDYSYQRKERLEKRYLNWKENEIISTDTSKYPVIVNYFRPHPMSESVNLNEDYLGFTLYKRNGAEVEPNTGIFHFVKSSDSVRESSQCRRRTRHAGAYRYIYGRCPEDDEDLVASGYCYRAERGLVYNSNTFNDIQSYADGSYYANTDREMNIIEKTFFNKCFNEWKDGGFQLSFICMVSSSFRVSSVMSMPNNTAYRVSSNDTCGDCDLDCNSNARLVVSSFVIIVALIFEKLLNIG